MRTGRPLVVLALVATALVTVFGTAQPWVRAATASGAGGQPVTRVVTGTELAPAAIALALVVGAAAFTLTVARRRTRWVVLAGCLLAALGVTAVATLVLLDPADAVRPVLAEHSGLTSDSLPSRAITTTLTPWPLLVAASGAVATVIAALGGWQSRHWDSSTRFESARTAPAASGSEQLADDPAQAWDALSHGEDPTRD